MATRAFGLDSPGIDEVARRLGILYQGVGIAKDPMFAWVQIVNDVTILGEDLRRNRGGEGAARAAKVLFRLLEFLGYYLRIHPITEADEFANVVARELRRRSYRSLFPNGPREGPTRWILAKYPHACSKCGQKPCQCLLYPWVIEDRRENPGPYGVWRRDAQRARAKLKKARKTSLTLVAMLNMFEDIYRNSYYNQEPWKVGMHLSEELGEATIELSRLELAWRGRTRFSVTSALDKVVEYATNKIDREVRRLHEGKTDRKQIKSRKRALYAELNKEKAAFAKGDGWDEFRKRVSEKFKEEVSDVFSWLSAVLVKLDPQRVQLEKQRGRFVFERGGVEYLKCAWCSSETCTDECLVTHGVSSEIIEKITKF